MRNIFCVIAVVIFIVYICVESSASRSRYPNAEISFIDSSKESSVIEPDVPDVGTPGTAKYFTTARR